MTKTKIFHSILSLMIVASMMIGSGSQAYAKGVNAPSKVGSAMPMSSTDESKVPHYFGPFPNWANSPFTVPD